MKAKFRAFIRRQSFFPDWFGVFINPFYFARSGLAKAMLSYAPSLVGDLLDVGCGTKPYKSIFNANKYIGLDIDSEFTRTLASADCFYDGTIFPFVEETFDSILCNQVLEHVFNPDDFLTEIYRVMKPGAKLLLTVPFAWDEHEQPFDYARYSSYGLLALLKRNKLKVIKYKKLGGDCTVLFQLLNAYLYKVVQNWNVYVRFPFTILVMGSLNILGIICRIILPPNPDLFLDIAVLAEKS